MKTNSRKTKKPSRIRRAAQLALAALIAVGGAFLSLARWMRANKAQTIHTGLLCWIVIRLEMINTAVAELNAKLAIAALNLNLAIENLNTNMIKVSQILYVVGNDILVQAMQARIQFHMAIESILSLFGKDGA